jgi:hypothetical protein
VIEVCIDNRNEGLAFGGDDLVAQLEAQGLRFRRVDRPSSDAICLWFTPIEGDAFRVAPPEMRRRLVVVAEGEAPTREAAEQTRKSLGVLGLIEPSAWRSWQRGLFVSWGLYGHEEIASAAGLTEVDTQGLQPKSARAALTAVLARFLTAAEAHDGVVTPPF